MNDGREKKIKLPVQSRSMLPKIKSNFFLTLKMRTRGRERRENAPISSARENAVTPVWSLIERSVPASTRTFWQ